MTRRCFALLSMTSHINKKNGGILLGYLHVLFMLSYAMLNVGQSHDLDYLTRIHVPSSSCMVSLLINLTDQSPIKLRDVEVYFSLFSW